MNTQTMDLSPHRARSWPLIVLQVAVALVILMAGSMKLTSAGPTVEMFDKIGFGQWFRYLTGLFEVTGAIALLIPTAALLGALLLTCVMLGAIATHLFILGGSPAPAFVLLLLLLTIIWMRRGELKSWMG